MLSPIAGKPDLRDQRSENGIYVYTQRLTKPLLFTPVALGSAGFEVSVPKRKVIPLMSTLKS